VSASDRASETDPAAASDPVATLDAGERAALAAVADRLIPEAHGMPSAASVLDDERLRFVLTARPDLVEPLRAALRASLPDGPSERLERLERDEPDHRAALQFVIVAGYYTDAGVRERIGYPGQRRLPVHPPQPEAYVEEGLIEQVLARGPVWKDPRTGRRAEPR